MEEVISINVDGYEIIFIKEKWLYYWHIITIINNNTYVCKTSWRYVTSASDPTLEEIKKFQFSFQPPTNSDCFLSYTDNSQTQPKYRYGWFILEKNHKYDTTFEPILTRFIRNNLNLVNIYNNKNFITKRSPITQTLSNKLIKTFIEPKISCMLMFTKFKNKLIYGAYINKEMYEGEIDMKYKKCFENIHPHEIQKHFIFNVKKFGDKFMIYHHGICIDEFGILVVEKCIERSDSLLTKLIQSSIRFSMERNGKNNIISEHLNYLKWI